MFLRVILSLILLASVATAVPIPSQLLPASGASVLLSDEVAPVSPPTLLPTSGQPVQPADGTGPTPPPIPPEIGG